MRLPRKRKGTTPVDVVVTEQNGLRRVRLSMGMPGRKFSNTDLPPDEARDLATMLNFWAGVADRTIDDPREDD